MSGRVVHVNDNVAGAVYIGRRLPRRKLAGHVFSNPYKVAELGREEALKRYQVALLNWMVIPEYVETLIGLRGKPLACWCRHEGEPLTEESRCHGDEILLLLAMYSDDELRELPKHHRLIDSSEGEP